MRCFHLRLFLSSRCLLITIAGFLICSVGLQEWCGACHKVMMIVLMVVMIFLAVYSFTMPGAKEGLKFYLVPDKRRLNRWDCSTLSQARWPGILYVKSWYRRNADFRKLLKRRKIAARRGDQYCGARYVWPSPQVLLFSRVLFLSRTAGQRPEADLYDTAAHLHLDEGRTDFRKLFFLFLFFAALSTIIAVFENIMCCFSEIFGVSRKQSAVINCILIILGSLPCALGYNVWSGFQPLAQEAQFSISRTLSSAICCCRSVH